MKTCYYRHIRKVQSDNDAMVLLLRERDLLVFLRQARNGKIKETHIQALFDDTVRSI